ncbi:MAG: L,D-transpeptidase family protein, partial [Candidatus Sericytochromatia bacterium]
MDINKVSDVSLSSLLFNSKKSSKLEKTEVKDFTFTQNDKSNLNSTQKNPQEIFSSEKQTIKTQENLDTREISTQDNNTNRFDDVIFKSLIEGSKTLKTGSKGSDVQVIQETLKDMGFYIGDIADGKFGQKTSIAITNFQSSRKLPETGIVDKATLQELINVAPPKGKKLWEAELKDKNIIPSNDIGNGKKAKVVIDLSEHRLFLYNSDNTIRKVYSVASGKGGWADGRGGETQPGIKVVNSKNNDPTEVSKKLWPETQGKAFGTRLLDLSWIDPKTGKLKPSGEELHGTYSSNSIGTNASHGCMRMTNEDIEEVFD